MSRFRSLAILSLSLTVFSTACRTTDPASLTGWSPYGEAVAIGPTLSVGELADHGGESVDIEGWVTDVCAVKGCWMRIRDDADQEVLVRFRDYGFFVPRNARGRRTVLAGTPAVTTLSVAQRRHLLEDAGASAEEIAAVTSPSTEVVVVADGVWIQGGGLEPPYATAVEEDCIIEEDHSTSDSEREAGS